MAQHILIVDDEPAIADMLAYALRTEGFHPDCVTLGGEALARLQAEPARYALVVLDVGLPDQSGFDVCRALRRRSDVPVLFLTARADEVDRIVGLELGADDYVPKPFSPREVASRIRAILRRARPTVPHTDAAPAAPPRPPMFLHDADGARIAYHGAWLPLTRYEYRLLATLLERPGRILSRAQLMAQVWHDAEDSLERTVDAHIKTLRAKLRACPTVGRTGTRDDGPAPCAPDEQGDRAEAADPIETHRGLGYSLRAR